MQNGKACGIIVYDSENRNSWRDEYAAKPRADQIAAKADHAILSTRKLLAGAQQVTEREGVLIANPAWVVTLAGILRREIVKNFSLPIAGKECDDNKAALYGFLTSEHYRQLSGSIDHTTEKLRQLDINEEKAHKKVWKTRDELIRLLQQSHSDITAEIERIIGTAEE